MEKAKTIISRQIKDRQMKKSLSELICLIRLTEKISTKIHGLKTQQQIFKVVKQEFVKSKKYTATILLLTDSQTKLKIAETSIQLKIVRTAEKITGLEMAGFKLDLSKSSFYRKAVQQDKIVQAATSNLIAEFLPKRAAYLASKILNYGQADKKSLLAPLKKQGRIIGIFAMTSIDLAECLIPSVKNLTEHISQALEIADQNIKRAAAEEKLRESESRYSALFKNAPVGIGLASLDGRVQDCNDAMCRMLGYQKQELKAVNVRDTYKYPEKRDEMLRKIKKDGFVRNFEVELKRKDNTIFCGNMTIILFLWKSEKMILTVVEDISQRKRIDQAKDDFVSIASHQLRTPLSTINWHTEILLSEKPGGLNKDQKEFLKEIHQTNTDLLTTVNTFLNISKIELGTFIIEPKKIDLKECLEEIIEDFTAKIQDKRIKLTKIFDKDISFIKADPNVLRIIIQNLISNAVKYTSENGRITIAVGKNKLNLVVRISDAGYGIPEDQQKNIFEKFFRADNIKIIEPEGTGLGLYAAKLIAERSGLKISFKSDCDKGTDFYVSIPLSGMKQNTSGGKLKG